MEKIFLLMINHKKKFVYMVILVILESFYINVKINYLNFNIYLNFKRKFIFKNNKKKIKNQIKND